MKLLPALFLLCACGSSPVSSPPAPAPMAAEPAPAAAPVAPAASAPGVGEIKDLDPIMGCSCTIALPDRPDAIWFGNPVGEAIAIAHLDGADRRLTGTSVPPGGSDQAGTAPVTFSGEGYTVTITWGPGEPCEPAEECESTLYRPTATIAHEGQPTATVQAAGACGC